MAAQWRIELLGGLRAARNGRFLTRFRTQKTGLLLAYLAYHLQRAHRRDQLSELLWPACEPHSGLRNLSRELSWLRQQLESPDLPSGTLLVADRTSVQLNPEAITTDVAAFEVALRAAECAGSPAERASCMAAAIDGYGGELLPGYYEDWILQERAWLAERYFQVLGQLLAHLERAGELPGALEYAHRAVRADPLREEAHYDLIRLYAAAGQPSGALRQYQELERLLREELGETPSAATRALAEELRRDARPVMVSRNVPRETASAQVPDSPPSSAPVVSPPLVPRLPLQLTHFFGREEEIARLAELLQGSETRLVTLTGPAGSGKTRLAIAVAGRLQEPFDRAVAFVPLADLTDARQVPDAIVDALGVPRAADRGALEQVVDVLNRQPSLLVLDNLEHLLAAGAPVVKLLLEQSATLACLVTSRQRLGLAGEQEFAVLPLPTPRKADTLERLGEYASVKLFVDRAQGAQSKFRLTEANAVAVAAVCDRLEGLPLALELAAARTQVVTPGQMLAHLEQRFEFLVSRRRDADARHRSLRAAIDWSYQLLSPDLQHFFVQLYVFRGGWTLAAAEAVCGEVRALDCLEQLRECSLVQTQEGPDEMRFRMLETLREYAAEQLTPEERTALQQRHLHYYLALAEEAERNHWGGKQEVWLDRLEAEHDNLRAALGWSAENGEAEGGETSLRLAGSLSRFWQTRGYWSEGRRWLGEVVARKAGSGRTAARARALLGAGELAERQCDYGEARASLEESIAIWRGLGDKRGLALSLLALGWVAIHQCNAAEAQALRAESISLAQGAGDRGILVNVLIGAAAIAVNLGHSNYNDEEQGALLQKALSMARELGCRWGIAGSQSVLGHLALDQGNRGAARARYEEALALRRELGEKRGIAVILGLLGRIAVQDRDWRRAAALWGERLGLLREFQGRLGAVGWLEDLGECAQEQGDYRRAARLLGAAEGVREAIQAPADPIRRIEIDLSSAAVRASLGEEAFAAAWAAGRAMPLEQAVTYALEEMT